MAMTAANKEVITRLNHLVEICRDGEKGFQAAAEGLSDQELKASCQRYSAQRAEFARELQAELKNLGEQPPTAGSLAGAIHRGWMQIRTAVTSKDDNAIIKECERGEDEAKQFYEEVLNTYMPAGLTGVIQRQY